MAISVPVFQEYRDVLSRKDNQRRLGLGEESIDSVMHFIAITGRPTNISYMAAESARASGSHYLITQNVKDFTLDADMRNDDLYIVTPAEFMAVWRDKNET